MQALTVRFGGVECGIQTEVDHGEPVVILGMPRKDGSLSRVRLDEINEPTLSEDGRIHEGALVRPEERRGLVIASDVNLEASAGLLLRLTTEGIPNSSVSLLGDEPGKIQVKGAGYLDPTDRNHTTWADCLHTLEPGKAVELIDRRTNSGIAAINADGELARMPKQDFAHLSSRSLMPMSFIERMLADNPLLTDQAREYLLRRSAQFATIDNPYRHLKQRRAR